jgi:hypothetical protein
MERLKMVLELQAAQPVYNDSNSGPIFAGWEVAVAPVRLSTEDFVRVAKGQPYRVVVELVEE